MHVITFSPEGQVSSLVNDGFPLNFLGDQKVYRVSEIRWHEKTQTWEVWFALDPEREAFKEPHRGFCGFESYNAARKFEVDFVNYCTLTGSDVHAINSYRQFMG